FLLLKRIVHLLDQLVGDALHVLVELPVLILGDLAVLFLLLERLEHVAPHVADRDLGVLGVFVRDLGELAAPLLAERRDRHAQHLAFRLRIEPEPGLADRRIDGLHHAAVPALHENEPRIGRAYGRELVERHAGAVGADGHGIEQVGAGASGAQSRELLLEDVDRAFHPAARILQYGILAHDGVSSAMMVKRPRPVTTSAKPPVFWIEKTRIGMRFSRASEIAAASITWRSRERTSR